MSEKPLPGARKRSTRGIAIAAVDHAPLFTDGLRDLVDEIPTLRWAGSTMDGRGCLRQCTATRPDVLLVDSTLDPRGHLTHTIVSANLARSVVTLVHHAHRTSRYLTGILYLGTSGLVPRSSRPEAIVDALTTAYHQGRYIATELRPLVTEPNQTRPTRPATLTAREVQVLRLLSDGLGAHEVADALTMATETARTHSRRILHKLDARNRAHAVTRAHQLGLLGTDVTA
jgi:DNA-binding NarL/FixJ family response regulator